MAAATTGKVYLPQPFASALDSASATPAPACEQERKPLPPNIQLAAFPTGPVVVTAPRVAPPCAPASPNLANHPSKPAHPKLVHLPLGSRMLLGDVVIEAVPGTAPAQEAFNTALGTYSPFGSPAAATYGNEALTTTVRQVWPQLHTQSTQSLTGAMWGDDPPRSDCIQRLASMFNRMESGGLLYGRGVTGEMDGVPTIAELAGLVDDGSFKSAATQEGGEGADDVEMVHTNPSNAWEIF
jgi:hypothetical protein